MAFRNYQIRCSFYPVSWSTPIIAYTGLSRRCLIWPETEMSGMAGDGDISYGWRWKCLVWLETEMSCMAGDSDVSYGCRWLFTLVRADGIQLYLYFHIYTGLVALLDRTHSSFSIITLLTGYEPSPHYNLYYIFSIYILRLRASKNPNPLTTIFAHQPQHHHHVSPCIVAFLTSSTLNMSNKPFKTGHSNIPKLVIATGSGILSAVRVWTAITGLFGSRPIQKPDEQTLGGPNLDRFRSPSSFCWVCLALSVPISGSAFQVSQL
jgi:hypothetical protein